MSLAKLALTAALSLALAHVAVAEDAAPAATEPTAAAAEEGAPAEAVAEAPEAAAAETDRAAEAAAPAEGSDPNTTAAGAAAPAEEMAPAEGETSGAASADAEATADETSAGAPVAESVSEELAPAQASKPAEHQVELGPVGHDAQGRQGRIHVVRKGDTLWDISDAYLGTPWVWPSLWKDNDDIRNPHLIFPGDRIWISPYEMRKVTEAEAAALLAAQGEAPPPAPAALAETDAMPETKPLGTFHYPDIDTAGFVTRDQYEGAAAILDSPETRKWLTDHSEVVIGLGAGEVQVGDQFDIFRTEARVVDLDTGLHYGWATKQLGWLEVMRVDEESSRAIIRHSRYEIQRGDHLLPRRVRSMDIPIQSSPGPLEGRIVHTPDQRLQMSQTEIVYLDRGTKDGLVVGSPIEIYRSLGYHGSAVDDAKQQERRMADHVVAKLLVVDVYDDTSVAVVTHTTEELNRGDHFRGADSIEP
jgi:nucleoid-associated protein YgaU